MKNSYNMYSNLTDFLIKHTIKSDDKKKSVITHTRIGDKEANIYAGSYNINDEEIETFMNLYYDDIFVKNKYEYLTEKQITDEGDTYGGILVDYDFRYDVNITERKHTKDHIIDIMILYLEELKNFFVFKKDKPFYVYIMEKPNINKRDDCVKDGIHMIIGIQMNHIMQQMLRKRILNKIQEIWEDLPIKNDWNSVLDEGISRGTTNWQLYGSRKPNNEAYRLTCYWCINFDEDDNEFMIEEKNIKEFDLKKNLLKLTARYKENEIFEINPGIKDEYNTILNSSVVKNKKYTNIKSKIKFVIDDDETDELDCDIKLEDIKNYEMLEKAINNIFKNLNSSDYYIKEIHEYTQILPEKYYCPGSHLLNRQVAFALKNTDERLFLSWIMLRSKSEDFDYCSIHKLYNDWKKYFNTNDNNRLTKKSIIYWAKMDAREEYEKKRKQTIGYFINESIKSETEYDFAVVLYQMFNDKFVCSSIKNNEWYVFKNHRWQVDKGNTLRSLISKDMFNLYNEKVNEYSMLINDVSNDPSKSEEADKYAKIIKKITKISSKMKTTHDKNNIMRESMELFYDKNFIKNIDTNKYLLGFNNGVIDFKNKIFRDGLPQDYITKSTNISYIDYRNEEYKEIKEEIIDFMNQLFPIKELNEYMWEHLASCLIGTNPNQTFNIYKGSGSNGKSKLTDLMSKALGDYKGTVPITLITEKRGLIGGTSSEVMQLKGVRYAVMQEPSKNMRINEGIMKELTGGDPLQGRSLYCESEIFDPQFTLVVCTNVVFDIYTTDDGTWRRIRIVPYLSKFVDKNNLHKEDSQFVFPKDKTLDEKFHKWAPVFMSMLVHKAFETDGEVKDCDIVLEESRMYRMGQDNISAFINDCVVKCDDTSKIIKKRELIEQFKLWFQNNASHTKSPKVSEINEYMDKKFKKIKNGWCGCEIIYDDDEQRENMF